MHEGDFRDWKDMEAWATSIADAEAISETLKESGIEVDVFHVKDVKKLNAKDYDFPVVGSPTRFGTMSFAIRTKSFRLRSIRR